MLFASSRRISQPKNIMIDIIYELLWCVIAYPIIPTLMIILITKYYVRNRNPGVHLVQICIQICILLHVYCSYNLQEFSTGSLAVRLLLDIILHLGAVRIGRLIAGTLFHQQWSVPSSNDHNHNDLWLFLSITDYAEMIDVVSSCKGCIYTYILILRAGQWCYKNYLH